MILPESDDAAKFVTGISGWVDRYGRFWGNDEHMARYCGSTHKHCDCGEIVEQRSYCKKCARRKEIEKFNSAERIEWDFATPIYSQIYDKYFFDYQELIDFISDRGVINPEDLELFICEPNYLSEIEADHWCDDICEDGELPSEIEEALDIFNDVIRKASPVSWTPGDYVAIVRLV